MTNFATPIIRGRSLLAAGLLLTTTACTEFDRAFSRTPSSQVTPERVLRDAGVPYDDVPKVVGSLQDMATKAEQEGDYNRAAQFYQQLVALKKNDARYQLAFGENLRKLERLEEAIAVYDAVLERQPNHVGALEGKGLAMLSRGDTVEAVRILSRILEHDAMNWRSINAIGIVFASKGKLAEALEYFNAALDVAPNTPSVLANKALVLTLQKEYTEATSLLHRARMMLPKAHSHQRQLALNLSMVHALSGNIDQAEKSAREVLTEIEAYNHLGYLAHLANDQKLAKAYLNTALVQSPVFYKQAWDNLEAVERAGKGRKRWRKRR